MLAVVTAVTFGALGADLETLASSVRSRKTRRLTRIFRARLAVAALRTRLHGLVVDAIAEVALLAWFTCGLLRQVLVSSRLTIALKVGVGRTCIAFRAWRLRVYIGACRAVESC